MELQQLRYFRVVARHEHMTRAAEELLIAQPSLSKTIRRLEHEVGVPLFRREGRSIRLNEYGKVFLAEVETALDILEAGRRTVRDMAGVADSTVSIASSSLIWLPDVLQGYQRQYPAVQFQLAQCALAEIPQRLLAGTADFGFLSVPIDQPGIVWQPLLNHELMLVVEPHHRLARYEHVPLTAVEHDALVVEKVGYGLRDLVDGFCRRAGFHPNTIYEIDEPAAVLEFVKAGLGVAFAPALVRAQIEKRGLQAIRISDPVCLCQFGMAWHADRSWSEAARTFHAFILGTVGGAATPGDVLVASAVGDALPTRA